jgi:signal recognition particle GTPase
MILGAAADLLRPAAATQLDRAAQRVKALRADELSGPASSLVSYETFSDNVGGAS